MMLERPNRVRRSDLRPGLVLWLLALLTFVSAPAGAQVLRIVDPPQWRENQPHVMATAAPLRIAGFVSQPGGIARVLVNGVPATLEPDPNFPDSYNFERIVPVDGLAAEVTITVEPRSGESWSRTFRLELPGQREQRREAAQPPAARTETPQRAGSNPWSGFTKRGILYGLVVAGGVVAAQMEKTSTSEVCEQAGGGLDCFLRTTTEPSYQTLGYAAAGVAVAALVIDAVMTSGKAKRMSSPSDDGASDSDLRLQWPSLSNTPSGVQVELLRLRFR